MIIEKLHIMPELERNGANDGYTYPEKYQNKLYEMEDYYIFFKKNKIDTFPKIIFDSVIEYSLEQKINQISSIISENSSKIIDSLINEKLNNTFMNINSSLETWTQRIESKVDLQDLQTFREEINIIIKQLTDIISNFSQPEISTSSLETTDIMEYDKLNSNIMKDIDLMISDAIKIINIKISELEKKIDCEILNTINYVDDKINRELEVVRQNIVHIIRDNMSSYITHTTSIKSGELSLSKLSAMKELGFTVDDIIKLNSEGLL